MSLQVFCTSTPIQSLVVCGGGGGGEERGGGWLGTFALLGKYFGVVLLLVFFVFCLFGYLKVPLHLAKLAYHVYVHVLHFHHFVPLYLDFFCLHHYLQLNLFPFSCTYS